MISQTVSLKTPQQSSINAVMPISVYMHTRIYIYIFVSNLRICESSCVAKGHRVEVIVFSCNPIVFQGFVHFTVSQEFEMHFASLKVATGSRLRIENRNFSVQVQKRKFTLAAPARKSQLFSTTVLHEVHFGSSGSKVATFQYKCSKGSTPWQLRLVLSCSCFYIRVAPYRKTMFCRVSFFVTLSFRLLLERSAAHISMSCPVRPCTFWSSGSFARRSYAHPRFPRSHAAGQKPKQHTD